MWEKYIRKETWLYGCDVILVWNSLKTEFKKSPCSLQHNTEVQSQQSEDTFDYFYIYDEDLVLLCTQHNALLHMHALTSRVNMCVQSRRGWVDTVRERAHTLTSCPTLALTHMSGTYKPLTEPQEINRESHTRTSAHKFTCSTYHSHAYFNKSLCYVEVICMYVQIYKG